MLHRVIKEEEQDKEVQIICTIVGGPLGKESTTNIVMETWIKYQGCAEEKIVSFYEDSRAHLFSGVCSHQSDLFTSQVR